MATEIRCDACGVQIFPASYDQIMDGKGKIQVQVESTYYDVLLNIVNASHDLLRIDLCKSCLKKGVGGFAGDDDKA